MNQNYLSNIRRQYEQFPYPPRKPEDERHRLLEVCIDRLDTINFYCFKGKQSFENFRVLVAGGGTADSTIYLAEQLRHKNAEVVYLDISQSSMDIAKQRAKIRHLSNIRWVNGSIMSISAEDMGHFDYISCTGVLHHLEDPQQGLAGLNSVLKPTGAMGLMFYGQYGRTGVYQLQKLMREINQDETKISNKINNARKILKELPKSNWFLHSENFFNDHKNFGDSGLVDLLLHEQDRSYTIKEIYELLGSANLQLIEFSDVGMRLSYRPEQYIKDEQMLAKIKQLDIKTQQGIAELLVGAFKKHEFYVSHSSARLTIADLNDLTNIPFFFPERQYETLGPQLAQTMEKNPQNAVLMQHLTGFEFNVIPSEVNALIFRNIDGKRDLRTIFSKVQEALSDKDLSDKKLLTLFHPVFEQLNKLDWLLLRGASTECLSDTVALQNRYKQNFLNDVS